ncbi:sugar-binding domain-containing protein [Cohnella hongkongensis]|uniref:Sugar-binding domain-containing protein n=1 Tax=Cohnella hongkongensis TaxID=178337 RepID=A0ABV9F9X7_9BACL
MAIDDNRINDTFANIAAGGMSLAGKGLVEPRPPARTDKRLRLEPGDRTGQFAPAAKMSTASELAEELERQRRLYAPFMERRCPEPPSRRIRREIAEFDWRIGTEADERNFIGVLEGEGEWTRVAIPHYGEPLGRAFTLYRAAFEVTDEMLAVGRIYLVFKGVDYKAHVFVNGLYLGSHEGFFAPFEFDGTASVERGRNILTVKVENDFICGDSQSGDKIYAATGIGYDDPLRGWHHCPPGMGIYQGVSVEARPAVHVASLFVRPLPDLEQAEAWIEVQNALPEAVDVKLRLSLYGRNFDETVFEGLERAPTTEVEVGMGDSFTEARLKAEDRLHAAVPLLAERGRNRFIVPLRLPKARRWEPESPWLYELHVELIAAGESTDAAGGHFGMRTFELDTERSPKGAMMFNGRQIRLRGANTMGHEQQCVAKGDWDQLRDDLLLAKICNMNFLRITQRPVQPEVYDYCDMLGLMTQTDLPLFGVLSRSQFAEAVRQAEEMERLVRGHPCNIMVTYINEPFPNASNKPHRHLTRPELLSFFRAADLAVRLNNPDRVIKHVDGDYDPPSEGLPDNHCYPCWYNGHGIDIGRLNRGWWLPVKPDWHYGCGEFGAEGLDPVGVMRRHYPPEWLPHSIEEEAEWSPNAIIGAQTGRFHYFFFETPNTLEDWTEESRRHQAWATRIMTEAFRRDARMTTFAIHLFIDAFPSGWMKTIMDVERTPKPAYFAYREALEPLMANMRADRLTYFAGEEIRLEAWICNDRTEAPPSAYLHCMVLDGEELLASARQPADIPSCGSACQGEVRFPAPEAASRKTLTVRLGLCDAEGTTLHDTELTLEVFPRRRSLSSRSKVAVLGREAGPARRLAAELELNTVELSSGPARPDILLVDDVRLLSDREAELWAMASAGTRIVALELEPGSHTLLGVPVRIKSSGMLPVHFVSRKTGHRLTEGFRPSDFRLWYDPAADCIAPLLSSTFDAGGMAPILLSGNTNDRGEWGPALAAAETEIGAGSLTLCQVVLAGRCGTNPVAAEFAVRLLEGEADRELR